MISWARSATQASRQDMETVIVTGDADMMQLVSPKVKVYYPRPAAASVTPCCMMTRQSSKDTASTPNQIADLKALKGDPSDNIPGVPGVGEKTALKLILQFGSVENMLEHLDEVEPAKLRDKLKENVEVVKQSQSTDDHCPERRRSHWILISAVSWPL